MQSGLGRHEIAQNISQAAQNTISSQSGYYWEVVAGEFISQGRTFGHLSSFKEAKIKKYVFEAVLDEVTTETCRFFHEKEFFVDTGLNRFSKLEKNPELAKELNPWVRNGLDEEGNKIIYYKKGKKRITIAEIEKPALGISNKKGIYTNAIPDSKLSSLILPTPPLHALCRSVILPVM